MSSQRPCGHPRETEARYTTPMPDLERPRADRMKLLLAPAFGPVQRVLAALRALPWPTPLQRVTARGLARLKARIPELAELLDGPSPARAPRPPSQVEAHPPAAELPELRARLESRDYQVRTKAAQALGSSRDAAATEALVGALRDRSVEVAVAAATSLAVSGGERGTRALLAVLDNAEGFYHPLVRASAVHGLGSLLPRHERAPLVRALRDLDAEVSIAAISALSSGSTEGAPPLLDVVLNADGFFLPITRLAAARGLERLSPHGSEALSRALECEGDPALREVMERLVARASARTALAE
jgi:HEAT repeat protein